MSSQLHFIRTKREDQTVLLLLFIRWVSLVPVVLAIRLPQTDPTIALHSSRALLLAVLVNILLTIFGSKVNEIIRKRGILLVLDLLFSGLLVWYTGAEASPFYLYSLTPIFGAAFFFQIRGGMWAASLYTLIYLLIVFIIPRHHLFELDLMLVSTQIVGFFVIALMVGYMSVLLDDLRRTRRRLEKSNTELARRNRDLNLIQELTLLLQSSVDPAELQAQILRGLVHDMGYRRATIGLYEEDSNILTGWLTLEKIPTTITPRQLSHAMKLSLNGDSGPISRAIRWDKPVEVFDGALAAEDAPLARRLVTGKHYLVLPLTLRQNPLGVIIIDQLPVQRPLPEVERESLERLAVHAGVALGSVRLCINRAQQQAVLAERNRIAAELHDSISQVLYGLAYGLDACVQLLPEHPETVRRELSRLQPVVAGAQALMRKAIFAMNSVEVTSESFSSRLHRHLNVVCPSHCMVLRIELPGEFDGWDAQIREQIYRVVQEAMTNAARHADPQRILITVMAKDDYIGVRVEDDGRGFDPALVDGDAHLGIQSMTERVRRLGGDLHIESHPDQGTVVMATIPAPRQQQMSKPEPIFLYEGSNWAS